jgi:uncharacterized protein (TIGR03083 family)
MVCSIGCAVDDPVDVPASRPRHNARVETFAEIADERRGLADLLAGLTAEQRAVPSLCTEWSVLEVIGHLVVPLQVSIPKFLLTLLVCGGNFDRANTHLARGQAQRPYADLVDTLRRRADSQFVPPGAGPEAPLTDLLVHGLDICWPLGITHPVPAERRRKVLTYLAGTSPRSFVAPGSLDGLRLHAADIDWSSGSGPTVSGDADALLLAMTGRSAALDHLTGEGAETLRSRRT